MMVFCKVLKVALYGFCLEIFLYKYFIKWRRHRVIMQKQFKFYNISIFSSCSVCKLSSKVLHQLKIKQNILSLCFIGRPLPQLRWIHENTVLDDSYTVTSEKKVKNILRLDKLQRHHLHAVLTCQASNNNVTTPISSAVTLNMNCKFFFIYFFIFREVQVLSYLTFNLKSIFLFRNIH